MPRVRRIVRRGIEKRHSHGLLLQLTDCLSIWLTDTALASSLGRINIVLLLLGMIMESTSLLVIVTPVLAPAVISMGVDPVQFGIILVFNMTIGGITPPVGGNMFSVMAITGVSMAKFSREILPFLAALIIVLLLLTYVPILSVGLPSLML